MLEKNPRSKARTNKKTHCPHMAMAGIEPRSHWWDASTRHLMLHVSKECYCFSHRYGTAKHEDLTKESG